MVALYMGCTIWAPVVFDGLQSISRSVQDGVMVPYWQAGNPYTQVNGSGPRSVNESYSATVELPLAQITDSEHD